MQFDFKKKTDPYSHWECRDKNNTCRLRVVPERGGLISEWLVEDYDVLYFDLERFKQNELSIRGGIPVLFPICGDLPGNCLRLPQGDFLINQHGFARDLSWNFYPLEDQRGFNLSLNDSAITRASYPYSFLLEMQVRPSSDCLEIKITLHNLGEQSMPFSIGLHPYFNVVNLEKVSIKGLSQTCFNHLKMKQDITSKQLNSLCEGVDFISDSEGEGLVVLNDLLALKSIEMKSQASFEKTVVWTDPPRPMLCLEPWTSSRNAVNIEEKKLTLNPGELQEFSCSFRIM